MIHTTPSSGTSEASHYLISNNNNNYRTSSLSSPSSLIASPSSCCGDENNMSGENITDRSHHHHHDNLYNSISSPSPTSPNHQLIMENQLPKTTIEDRHEDLKYFNVSSPSPPQQQQHQSPSLEPIGGSSSKSWGFKFPPNKEAEEEDVKVNTTTSIRSVIRRFSHLNPFVSSTTKSTRHSIGLVQSNSNNRPPPLASRKFSMGHNLHQSPSPPHPNTAFIWTSPHSPPTITPSPTTSSSSLMNDLDHHDESDEHHSTSAANIIDVVVQESPTQRANTSQFVPPPFTRTVSIVFNSTADETTCTIGSERKRRDSIAKVTERSTNLTHQVTRQPSNITNLIHNTSFHSTKKQLEKEKKRRGESCSKFCRSCFTTSNILLTVFILQSMLWLLFGISIMRNNGEQLVVKIREYQILQIRAFVEERINSFTNKYITMTSHMMEGLKGISINDNVALLRYFDYVHSRYGGIETSLKRMEFYRMDDSFSMLRDFNLSSSGGGANGLLSISSKSNRLEFSSYNYPNALLFMDNPGGYYASSSDASYSVYKNYMFGPLLTLDEVIGNQSSTLVPKFLMEDQLLSFSLDSNNISANYNNFHWSPTQSINNSSIFLHYPVYISNSYNHSISDPNLKKMFIVNSAQNLNSTYLFGVFSLHFSIDKFSNLLNVQNERFYLESEHSLNTSFIMNTRGEILATRQEGQKQHKIDMVNHLYRAIMKKGFKKNCEIESETLTFPKSKLSARLSYTCDGHGLNLVLVVGIDNSDSFIPSLLANNYSILSFLGAFGLILVSIITMIVIMRSLNTSLERIGKKLHRITKLKEAHVEGIDSSDQNYGSGMKSIVSNILPASNSNSLFFEVREIEQMVSLLGKGMDALKKFLPEPFVKEIMISKPLKVATKQNLTVLFCELAGCDMMADRLDIALFLEMITEYSSIMCKIIQDHNGIIDRFDGGTAICLFSFPDHSLIPSGDNKEINACHAAMDIIYMMNDFKTKWTKLISQHSNNLFNSNTSTIHIEIGINSGEIYYGNFNCTQSRSCYSVLGSNLDIAFTLQRFNYTYSTQVLIGEETFQKVKDNFVCYFVDLIKFSGLVQDPKRSGGMKIYSLECPVRESTDLERKIAADLNLVQKLIMEREYEKAKSCCEKILLLNDRPQIEYLHSRLEHAAAREQEEDLAGSCEESGASDVVVCNGKRKSFGIDPEQVSQFL